MSDIFFASLPWQVAEDCTVFAADDTPVCVMGDPLSAPTDQDRLHAVAVSMLPEIVGTLGVFFETFQPDGWTAEEYPDVARAADILARLSAAGYRTPVALPAPHANTSDLLAKLKLAESVLVTAFGEPSGNAMEHGRAAGAIVSIRATIAEAEGGQ